MEVPAAVGEEEMWVERVRGQGAGASGASRSWSRLSGQGLPGTSAAGGRGEDGGALFFRAHLLRPRG